MATIWVDSFVAIRDIAHMTLHDFIERHGPITQADLAKRIGISRSYLAEIISGAKRPGRSAIEKIEAATDGAVPASSWFAPREDQP